MDQEAWDHMTWVKDKKYSMRAANAFNFKFVQAPVTKQSKHFQLELLRILF